MSSKWVKILGAAVSIVGVAVNLLSDWVNQASMDSMIEEKLDKALDSKNNEE